MGPNLQLSSNVQKLFLNKLIHTVVWVFLWLVLGYILYAGIFNVLDTRLVIAVGIVILEGIILILFKWRCPLTVLAYRYTDDRRPAVDIFLPEWLAEHNKTIYSILFALGLVMIIYRLMS